MDALERSKRQQKRTRKPESDTRKPFTRIEVVVGEPAEVRYVIDGEGLLQVFVGKGLGQAPAHAETVHVTEGHTTWIIEEA